MMTPAKNPLLSPRDENGCSKGTAAIRALPAFEDRHLGLQAALVNFLIAHVEDQNAKIQVLRSEARSEG